MNAQRRPAKPTYGKSTQIGRWSCTASTLSRLKMAAMRQPDSSLRKFEQVRHLRHSALGNQARRVPSWRRPTKRHRPAKDAAPESGPSRALRKVERTAFRASQYQFFDGSLKCLVPPNPVYAACEFFQIRCGSWGCRPVVCQSPL